MWNRFSERGENGILQIQSPTHLTHESIKILGCHHSHDADLASSHNFFVLLDNMQAVLNLWRTRDLTLEGKIQIFKTLGLSKMQYLAMMSNVPNFIIETLKVIHNKFLWSNKPERVKQTTLLGNYSDGGLRAVDIVSKLKALKMTWIRRLVDNNFHRWKIIPRKYLTYANNEIICHRNLPFDQTVLNKINGIPVFYVDLLKRWSGLTNSLSEDVNMILTESVWLNRSILIDNRSVFNSSFSTLSINTVRDLYNANGNIVTFDEMRHRGMPDTLYYNWLQIIYSIPNSWKAMIRGADKEILERHSTFNKNLICFGKKCYPITDITCKNMYNFLISTTQKPPTLIDYWTEKLNLNLDTEWDKIFLIPRRVTMETKNENISVQNIE